MTETEQRPVLRLFWPDDGQVIAAAARPPLSWDTGMRDLIDWFHSAALPAAPFALTPYPAYRWRPGL